MIDTFLLSCRVLGRGVEDVFLTQCLKRAKARGARTAIGEFFPTPKNQMAQDFYRSRGFLPANGGGSTHLEMPLEGFAGTEPAFFKRIETIDA